MFESLSLDISQQNSSSLKYCGKPEESGDTVINIFHLVTALGHIIAFPLAVYIFKHMWNNVFPAGEVTISASDCSCFFTIQLTSVSLLSGSYRNPFGIPATIFLILCFTIQHGFWSGIGIGCPGTWLSHHTGGVKKRVDMALWDMV